MANESPINRLQSSMAKHLTIEALKHINKNEWDRARVKIAQSKDPLAAKLYYWLLLTNKDKPEWTNRLFVRLSHFIRQNSEWPNISKMKLRAEGVMPETLSNAEVMAWYDDFPPKTPYGMGRYMDAMIIDGKRDRARLFLADWWADTLISRSQQRVIFKKYGNFLTVNAHAKRFDALLLKRDYDNAIAIAGVLGRGYKDLAHARIALAKNKNSGLDALIEKVPTYLQDNAGLLYERLKWRRERNLNSGALEILRNSPDGALVLNPKDWWRERHIMIRRLLEKGEYKQAYNLAENHIQKDGFAYAQAEWLTGWLALRFMDRPAQALMRFSAMHQKVKTPVSKARAAYWAGRAAYDLRQFDLSKDWYKKAGSFQTVFYGQLAQEALSRKVRLSKSRLPKLFRSDRRNYRRNELVQASILFDEAGMGKSAENFIYAFLKNEGTPKAYLFAAEMFAEKGDSYAAVKVTKKATRKGLFLTKQAYPTITKHLSDVDYVEWALIHALIRQESMFDPKAKSPAGARGLMQVMPKTASGVSKKLNVGYKKSWLTSKPSYNILIGSNYIAQMIKRYDGSYPLAIAAYNAGPGRVNSWLKLYGDPRKGEVNLIDWIELIPIYETRNYVQRVMEGTHTYRLRLKGIQRQPREKIHVAIQDK